MSHSVLSNLPIVMNFINGEWVSSCSQRVENSTNPANIHKVVGIVQESDAQDLGKRYGQLRKPL
jgi:acyl-CoA reductase-like NAD-dependent aldehyde dehydrogenase